MRLITNKSQPSLKSNNTVISGSRETLLFYTVSKVVHLLPQAISRKEGGLSRIMSPSQHGVIRLQNFTPGQVSRLPPLGKSRGITSQSYHQHTRCRHELRDAYSARLNMSTVSICESLSR